MGSPEDRILEDGRESRILEQVRMVAHKDINIPSLVVFVCPDDGVIPHLDLCVRSVSVFIHTGKHMDIGARRLIVRVPLFMLDNEGSFDALHRWMSSVLDGYSAVD